MILVVALTIGVGIVWFQFLSVALLMERDVDKFISSYCEIFWGK